VLEIVSVCDRPQPDGKLKSGLQCLRERVVNPKNILLLSGASVVLLAPPAIANPSTEAIPDSSVVEADLQTLEPVVVEVQVAPPEPMVEAIAPVVPVPTVSPPEPFAPDFSAAPASVSEAIAPPPVESLEAGSEIVPDLPEPVETGIEPIPVVDRADEIVSSSSEELREQDEKSDQSVATVTEASPISSVASSEPIGLIGPLEEAESTEELDEPIEELDEPTENAPLGAIAPNAESPDQQSNNSLVELPSQLSSQLGSEFDSESPSRSLGQVEAEWTENSPRLYGASEAETDLIQRLAEDDLDRWAPEQWIDLLLSEDDPAEENVENGDYPLAEPSVSELNQEAEFSQTRIEALEQPIPQRDVSLERDPHRSESDAPQTPNSASVAPASADNNFDFDTNVDNRAETAPRYRLVVDDRLILNVQPYRFNWKPSHSPDSIRKQKLRGRSPAARSTSPTGISAGIGFDLQISNRAQLQFAYGAQDAKSWVSKSKTIPSVQRSIEMPSPIREVKAEQIRANQLVKTESLTGTLEKSDLVERIEPIEGSNPVRGTASSGTSTNQSISTVREAQLVTLKTEKTNLTGELSKPAFSFNRSFEWRITPTIVLNTWGGLTVNPLPPDSPILSLTYLFYLGFPDPLDRGSDRLIFMVGQPSRTTEGRALGQAG
jgi:hypothetical protein